MDYRRVRECMSRRKGTDPADLTDWGGPELASLGWLLGLRVLHGSFFRFRLGHNDGLGLSNPHTRVRRDPDEAMRSICADDTHASPAPA